MIKMMLIRLGIVSVCGVLYFNSPSSGNISYAPETNDEVTDESTEDAESIYMPGDKPYYIQRNGYTLGYVVVHSDLSYSNVGEEEYRLFCQEYCTATGVSAKSFVGECVGPDDFVRTIQASYFDNASSSEEAITKCAIYVNDIGAFPEASAWKIFEYNEETWYTYMQGTLYYYTDEETYNRFLTGEIDIYSDSDILLSEYGYGNLYLHLLPSASISDASFYIELTNIDTEEVYNILCNPPTYNTTIKLPYGEYVVTKAGLYNDAGYPLDISSTLIRILDGQDTKIDLSVADPSDNISIDEYNDQLIEEANKTAGGTTIDPSTISSNVADFKAEPKEEVVVVTKRELPTELIIGGVVAGILVIALITGIIIKRNMYEDDD